MASRELVTTAPKTTSLTSPIAAAITAAQNETATTRAALASAQSDLERLRTAVDQVLSSATDLIGTSTSAQLLERIRKQLSPAPAPVASPVPLTGTTMYSGRGAPRRSDYRDPSVELVKPCTPTSPEGAKLYMLPDGTVRSLSSLSVVPTGTNVV